MKPCPKCGSPLAISNPLGPTAWQENCQACGYEGGGTVSFAIEDILSGDHGHSGPNQNTAPIVASADVGHQRAAPSSTAKIQAQARQAAAELEATADAPDGRRGDTS